MVEGNYKKAIFDALTEEYTNMLLDVTEDHIFSSGFENRMKKLVKRRSKSYYKMINTTAKRVACVFGIIFIASFSTIMSVSALREAFIDFIVSIFEKYSVVRSANDSNAPTDIEDKYYITIELDNYEIVYSDVDYQYNNTIYRDKNNNVIDFTQYVKSEFDIAVNTEGADVVPVVINGAEAIYYEDNQGYGNVIWDNGDYIFYISSNLGKDALIDIAKSVQKGE